MLLLFSAGLFKRIARCLHELIVAACSPGHRVNFTQILRGDKLFNILRMSFY